MALDAKKKSMLKALEASLGIVSTASQKSGVPRRTHYAWLNSDPEYREAVNELDCTALDFAETALHEAIRGGSVPATIFFLKCRGKKRGYVEQISKDDTGNNKGAILAAIDFALKNPIDR